MARPLERRALSLRRNAGDAARLSDPSFRDTVAEAVVAAVTELYAVEE